MKLLLALSFVAALAEEGLRGNYGLQVEKTIRNIDTIGSAGHQRRGGMPGGGRGHCPGHYFGHGNSPAAIL